MHSSPAACLSISGALVAGVRRLWESCWCWGVWGCVSECVVRAGGKPEEMDAGRDGGGPRHFRHACTAGRW
eukprot:8030488-Alexandrium_andersonii.AAC.1